MGNQQRHSRVLGTRVLGSIYWSEPRNVSEQFGKANLLVPYTPARSLVYGLENRDLIIIIIIIIIIIGSGYFI